MDEELVVLVLEIKIEVWKPNKVLIHEFADLSYFYGCNSILYFEAAIVSNYFRGDLVNFVFKQDTIYD